MSKKIDKAIETVRRINAKDQKLISTGSNITRQATFEEVTEHIRRASSGLPKGRALGTKANKDKRAANESELETVVNKIIDDYKIKSAVGINRAIWVKPGVFFPDGVPYAESTMAKKIAEILQARRKAKR